MKPLSNKQKKEVVYDLEKLTYWQVAMKSGIDKYYKRKNSAIDFIRKVYLDVKSRPQSFGISQEKLEAVQKALDSRNLRLQRGEIMIKPNQTPEVPKDDLTTLDTKALVTRAKKSSWVLLNKKLDMIDKSPKALKMVQVGTLAQVAGIVFDKGQIAKGEATEHVLLRAKIDDSLTNEQKLELILSQREKIITQKPDEVK